MSVRTWSVTELCEGIVDALAESFPDQLWIRGEIHGYRVSPQGHVYFELVEVDGDRPQQAAKLGVTLFRGPKRGVDAVLRRVGGLELADGLDVRIRATVSYYPPQGRVQLLMNAIDPRHTLGKMAADREMTLRRLAADGLLEANGRLELSELPLRIGLITSDGSAAANDVLDELDRSGFAFRVRLADARVQGVDAPASMLAAFDALGSVADLDVIAIVRGGGARTDLMAFDDEQVARRIASYPVPVLTGIGHEIDRSVADEVAHTALKTPTAVGALLVERVRSATIRLETRFAEICAAATRSVHTHALRLDTRTRHLAHLSVGTLGAASERADHIEAAIRRRSHQALARTGATLTRHGARVDALTRMRLRGAEAELAAAQRRLADRGPRAVGRAERRMHSIESVVRAVHPQRTLARGFSLTRTETGELLRDAEQAPPGTSIVTTLHEGEVTSSVTSSRRDP